MRRRSRSACAALALTAGAALAASAGELADLSRVPAASLRERRFVDSFRDHARAPRTVWIESSPLGATASIVYLRDGVELARLERIAPFHARIPGVALAGERDQLVLRLRLAGHAPRELAMSVRNATSQRISLAPLPARLLRASLLELGDSAELRLASDRALNARVASSQRGDRLVIADLALDATTSALLGAIRGAGIARIEVARLGADVAIETERAPALEAHALRLAAREDPVSGEHALLLQWVPPDEGAATRSAARRALEALEASDVAGCTQAFEQELRAALRSEHLASAWADERSLARAFLPLVLARLAELSAQRELVLLDETRLRLESPLERAIALERASEVRGALAAVRALARSLAPRGHTEQALAAWLSAGRLDPAALARVARAEALCMGAR